MAVSMSDSASVSLEHMDSLDSLHPDNEWVPPLEDLLDDDDEDFYIPPPRPDLDLGPDAANICRVASPAASYSSISSDILMERSELNRDCVTRILLERTDSFSSSYSVDSEDCEQMTPKVTVKEYAATEATQAPDFIAEADDLRQDCLTVEFCYKAISDTLKQLSNADQKTFCQTLWRNYPESLRLSMEDIDVLSLVDDLLDCSGMTNSLNIARTVLKQIGRKMMASHLSNLCRRNEVQHDLRQSLRTTYGIEGDAQQIDDFYTDLDIRSTVNGPNVEHEVLKLQRQDQGADARPALTTKDIWSQDQVESNVTLMFLTGVAGSGKSSLVRKLILDWVDKRSHQHVSFLFLLPFRMLQQFEGHEVSLMDILHALYPETERLSDSDFLSEDSTMMFVCDGLDEYREELDFVNTELLCDHTERTSLNVLVVNLLRGRLLYRGVFLITTRPQARRCVPWDVPHQMIGVRGFSEEARIDFFRKRFEDKGEAESVLSFLQSSPTLHAMCHLPLFCSLVADECRHRFRNQSDVRWPPGTLCYIYTKFLLVLMNQRSPVKAPLDLLVGLGRVAFRLLQQDKFAVNKSDWSSFGVSDEEAVTHTGICTEYVTKPLILYEEKVIGFIHPTVQEHLAALYAFVSFERDGRNVFTEECNVRHRSKVTKNSLYHSAVLHSIQCDNGLFDIFLRFLSGLHLKVNTDLLSLFCQMKTSTDGAVAVLRKTLEDNQYPERNHNLTCCLLELQHT